MKFVRNKKHRPHSTTSKNERNANRQKLKKMINQNLLTIKKFFFWNSNSEISTTDSNTWKWIRDVLNWFCNAKNKNSFFSSNTVLNDELMTKITNSEMSIKERTKNWSLNFNLKKYINKKLKNIKQTIKIFNKATEYWHYLIKKKIQLHEQKKTRNWRKSKTKIRNFKTSTIFSFMKTFVQNKTRVFAKKEFFSS